MTKVRTITGVYDEIKAGDPRTAITIRAIRRAVSDGEIPSRRVGKKYLVSTDAVMNYFSGGDNQ